jgi:hypothetical protein
MNIKKSLIAVVSLITIFSYGNDKVEIITKEFGTNTVCNIKNASELEKSILNKICSFEAMYKIGISEKKAQEIKNKLCDLDIKEKNYCKKINKLAEKQLKLLMDENLNEKEIYKLVDEIGDLKIKIAKLKIDAIILMKKNFTAEQIKQLK